MGGMIIVVLLVVFIVSMRSALKKSKQAVTQAGDGASKRYFPAEGIGALLDEKYVQRSPAGTSVYWACFLDDDGGWWNLRVSPGLYEELEEGSHGDLLLDAGGTVLVRFGEIENREIDPAEALPELEMDIPVETFDDPEVLSEAELDGLEAFWAEPLPTETVELRAETRDFAAFDPVVLLRHAALPKYLRTDPRLQELVADVFGEVKRELAGYGELPRQAEAGDFTTYRGTNFHVRLAVAENAAPLESSISGTLGINTME